MKAQAETNFEIRLLEIENIHGKVVHVHVDLQLLYSTVAIRFLVLRPSSPLVDVSSLQAHIITALVFDHAAS